MRQQERSVLTSTCRSFAVGSHLGQILHSESRGTITDGMDLASLDGPLEKVDEGSVAAAHLTNSGAFGLVLFLLLRCLLPITRRFLPVPHRRGYVAAALHTRNARQQ